jgi:biopolymer transport protein ExbD
MAAPSSGDGEDIVGINVTPLVDITLVLLIIFMVTAKLVVSQAMPLDLPKAASAGETQSVLNVSIEPDGAVHVNGRALSSDAALREAFTRELKTTPDVRAVLSASSRVPHGTVMHVLDLLRTSGITKVAFGAEKIP